MEKRLFTISDIAQICRHSKETVKRWLEKIEIKGYRVRTSDHWQVRAQNLILFLKNNNIPFLKPNAIDISLRDLIGVGSMSTFCWEFYKNTTDDHSRSQQSYDKFLLYNTKSINCYA